MIIQQTAVHHHHKTLQQQPAVSEMGLLLMEQQQRNDRRLTHFNRHGQLYIGTTTHGVEKDTKSTHSRDRDFVKIGGYDTRLYTFTFQ